MKRIILLVAAILPLLVAAAPRLQAADAGVSIRVGDRYQGTRFTFESRPTMTVIPKSRVYYIRDYDGDVYRYGRFYYGYDQGRWYRASSYRGPWIYVRGRTVPRSIYGVSSEYRRGWQGDYNYWRTRDYDDRWEQYQGNGANRDGTMKETTPPAHY